MNLTAQEPHRSGIIQYLSFLWLIYFTSHSVLKVQPCCSMWQTFISFKHFSYLTFTTRHHIHLWKLEVCLSFPFLAKMGLENGSSRKWASWLASHSSLPSCSFFIPVISTDWNCSEASWYLCSSNQNTQAGSGPTPVHKVRAALRV